MAGPGLAIHGFALREPAAQAVDAAPGAGMTERSKLPNTGTDASARHGRAWPGHPRLHAAMQGRQAKVSQAWSGAMVNFHERTGPAMTLR